MRAEGAQGKQAERESSRAKQVGGQGKDRLSQRRWLRLGGTGGRLSSAQGHVPQGAAARHGEQSAAPQQWLGAAALRLLRQARMHG